ncbi:v-SNARE protein [Blumeria graminis f. sp. tritici 96224]|uniref:V-SNARE protein n=1 Tax=Blumeria graminis f. sp. tritici 96224 TaxID=1268274 RepID=A0A656KMR6_BLUGR|nr:v-SNARE protein [Blumeria graminis f. sp. tritici 96224]
MSFTAAPSSQIELYLSFSARLNRNKVYPPYLNRPAFATSESLADRDAIQYNNTVVNLLVRPRRLIDKIPPKNSLFNTALKQSTALKRDLSASHTLSPALLGQLSASLTSFSRTLDSFAELARSELNTAKKAKAEERLQSFRADLAAFRSELRDLQAQNEDAQAVASRSELLGRRPHNATAMPDNPYSNTAVTASASADSPWAPKSTSMSMGSGDAARETHAFREQQFFSQTNSALDDYLARGQAVLGDLNQQREILKGTQKKLYSVANTLGISGDTIRVIERRAKQDKWIFYAGALVFFAFCWLVLHYF